MSWAKLDDGILDNPKILRVGPLGFAFHVAGIVWCARNLTDGYIPLGKVATLLDVRGLSIEEPTGAWMGGNGNRLPVDTFELAETLVNRGLWEGAPGGYQIHDFLDYNPSKIEVESRREVERKRQKRHRKNLSRRDSVRDSTASHDPVTHHPVPVPVPVPVPQTAKPLELLEGGHGGKKRTRQAARTPLPDGFALSDEMRDFAVKAGLEPVYELNKFKDYHLAEGSLKKNWVSAWRYWVRNGLERLERAAERRR